MELIGKVNCFSLEVKPGGNLEQCRKPGIGRAIFFGLGLVCSTVV